MKKRLLSYTIFTFLCFLLICQQAFAQATASFAYLSGGVSDNVNPVTSSSAVVYGFSVSVSGSGSITFSKYYLGVNNGSATSNFANATLVRCTSTTYSAGASTPVGSVTMSSGTGATAITIDNLTETISAGSSNNYFLVVDVIGTSSSYCQLYSNNSRIATDDAGTNYNSGFNKYTGNNFSNNSNSTNVPLRITPETSGLNSNSSPLLAGGSDIAMFGFSLTGSGTYNLSQIYINSNISTLSQYFNGFTLYTTGTSATYSTGTRSAVTSTVSMSGSYVSVAISGSNLQATTTKKYYWLVANLNSTITGTIPADLQFNISKGQSSTAFASSGGNCNTATVFGPSYNVNYTSLTVNAVTTGTASGTITALSTGNALFGFSVATSSGSITVSGFNINCTNTPGSYFNNPTLYSNNSATFSGATPVSGAVVNFSGNYAVVTGLSETITTTAKYYFLVADNYGGASSTTTLTFNFTNGQSSSAIIQSTPTSSYNTFTISGNTLTMPSPSVIITSANSASTNGISSGVLYYGRKDIVLFGFGVQAFGAAATITAASIKVTGVSESNYFSNTRLYRSTTPVFPGGTALYSSSNISGCNCGYYRMSGVSETVPANTTYYYFVVVDYTGGSGSTPASITLSFANTQSGFDSQITVGSKKYNTGNFSGTTFTIADTEIWTGNGANGNINNSANYQAHNGGNGFTPGIATVIYVGNSTNPPVINSSITIGGLAITNNATVSLSTSTLGANLTLNNGLYIGSGATLNYSSSTLAGKIILANGSTSIIEPTGTLNLSGLTTIDNTANTTGSFILESDATGTGSIGALPSTLTSLTGTYVVQRYFTGGSLSNRGYRLMSFPVNTTSTNPLTTLNASSTTSNFTSMKTNLLITGAGGSTNGWDQPSGYSANGPTILFYNNAGAGSFTIPTTFSSTTAKAGQGFYFYFRGDNVNNLTNKVVKSGTYATPETGTIGLQSGTLNQQGFTYTLSNAGTAYNLVGNPYPSSISVTSACLTGTTGFVYTYTPGGNSITSNTTPFTIASGQGFFLKSNSALSSIAFTESLKTTGQPGTLLLGTPATTQEGNIKLQMVQDSANYDFAQLRFMDSYTPNYIDTEDAEDFNGSGQVVFFGAMTADKHVVGIASQPLDKKLTSVYLSVNDNTSGTFKINKIDLSNIPDKFDVWLIDHFAKDSLDLRAGTTYSFAIDKNNPATYGNSRMEVVIRTKVLPPYQLVTFTGKRASSNNVLNWTVKNEYTYTYFELQRSFDNKTFEGVNNSYSTGTGSYTFTDQSNKPLIYYRLKQTDINDNVTYSSIVILKSDAASVFSVYPNPTDNTLHFALTQEVKTSVTLRVYNSLGTLMKIKTYSSNSGDQDVSTLTPGSYMAELIDDATKKLIASAKFIKL